jgi:hypothetical protein
MSAVYSQKLSNLNMSSGLDMSHLASIYLPSSPDMADHVFTPSGPRMLRSQADRDHATAEILVDYIRGFSNPRPTLMTCIATLPGFSRVEVRDSPGKGRGIFATCDIGVGCIVTFYPADIVYEIGTSHALFLSDRYADWKDARQPGAPSLVEALGCAPTRYCYGHPSGDFAIVGLPFLCDNPAYLGHMANDALNFHDGMEDYDEEVYLKANNATFKQFDKNLVTAIVATRDIRQGEEVTVPYGRPYWSNVWRSP